jgi:hypothetical protein
MIEGKEVITVYNPHPVSLFQAEDLDRLNGLLVLDEAGTGGVVGETEPVEDEIVVVGLVAKVSTVSHVLLAVFCLCPQALDGVNMSIITSRPVISPRNLHDWPTPR